MNPQAAFLALLVAFPAAAQSFGGSGGDSADLILRANITGAGLSVESKFGHNPDVGSGGHEDIWAGGGAYPFPTSALAVRAKAGGDAADTAAGAGARTVTVVGLDANWTEVSDTITLAGASVSAATSQTFIRIKRSYVATAGTYTGNNTAAITIETTAGTTLAIINAGAGQTQSGIFTVPAGKTAYLMNADIIVASSTGKSGTVRFWRRENADDSSAPVSAKRLVAEFDDIQGHITVPRLAWPSFPAKTDVWSSGIGTSGSTNIDVTMDFLLKDTP